MTGALEQKLRLEQELNERMETFYKTFVRFDDLVFDIGANVGSRTAIFRKIGARVLAVEPHEACVSELRRRFEGDEKVAIVSQAAGSCPGKGYMITGACASISSLSLSWVTSVIHSDRFDGYQWNAIQQVPVTTLDDLIEKHGRPDFIKIDVEGFEDQVLSGLSSPVRALSFEFHPEHLASTEKCILLLESLGQVRFTYAIQETMELHPDWVTGKRVLAFLNRFVGDNKIYGDVYARFE